MKSYHCVVTGKVTTTNFLAWVHDHAVNLGLKGWVRHLDGERVEVMAQGQEPVAEKLGKVLKEGSTMSGMTQVKTEWLDYPTVYEKFEMR